MPAVPEPPETATNANPGLWSARNMALLYDLAVTRGTYRWWWRCPWPVVARLYAGAIRPATRHLELGPGTGFFLDRLTLEPVGLAELHLLDLHSGPLQVTAARLARHQPTAHHHDALGRWPLPENSLDSVAAGMLLHCLPGANITAKGTLFTEAARVLCPGGTFLGTTVLGLGVAHTPLSRLALRRLNTAGVFHNTGDDLTDLARELHTRFDDVHLAVRGSVAVWQVRAR